MNKLYKIALTLLLSTHTILWATSTPAKSYDFTENGMCFSMHKLGDARGATDEHRGVSFDGGGIRGAMEALWAVSIEEAANNEYAELTTAEAKKAFLERTGIYKRRNITDDSFVKPGDIRFQDFFDFAAGTSTGSICAAALFHKERFRAIELLNLYVNLSAELFDIQKRTSGTGGIYTSRYAADGLEGLLSAYFGNDIMGNSFGNKKVYFGLTNETTRSLELVTNQVTDTNIHPGSIKDYTDKKLTDIIGTSCFAPTFFDGKKLHTGLAETQHQFCDGGLCANGLGIWAYKMEGLYNRAPSSMCSFGTGSATEYDTRAHNATIVAAKDFVPMMLAANTAASVSALKAEVGTNNSSLRQLHRINTSLTSDEQKLDDTSAAYLKLLMEKAYECTQTDVFKSMMTNLGLKPEKIPDLMEITKRVNSLKKTFFDKVVSNEQFANKSKEDYLLRSCLRRVCALDEEWFAPTSIVNTMDQKGVLSSENSDDFLKNLQKNVATSKNNKANSVLRTYFSAKKALEKISPLNQNQFDASLSEVAIQNAKAELNKKAKNSSLYTTLSGGANLSDSVFATVKTFLNYNTTTQNPDVAEDPILKNEDANTVLSQEIASANFNRDNQNQNAIESDRLTGWTDGNLSEDDKSMWKIINNYLAYLNDAGIKDTSYSDVLSIASTLYVNTLFQNISKDDLGKFHQKLQDLTTYLEDQKPLSSVTSLCRPAIKTLTMGYITGGTRLTSLLEAVQKRIDNKPCLENSISEIPKTNDAAANAGE